MPLCEVLCISVLLIVLVLVSAPSYYLYCTVRRIFKMIGRRKETVNPQSVQWWYKASPFCPDSPYARCHRCRRRTTAFPQWNAAARGFVCTAVGASGWSLGGGIQEYSRSIRPVATSLRSPRDMEHMLSVFRDGDGRMLAGDAPRNLGRVLVHRR